MDKYSHVVLTDENFDYELEKLCTIFGLNHSDCVGFVNNIDGTFMLQDNCGIPEWINYKVVPDINCDCNQAHQTGELAYEFANGFIVINFETLL